MNKDPWEEAARITATPKAAARTDEAKYVGMPKLALEQLCESNDHGSKTT
jgi:hypothetical protein